MLADRGQTVLFSTALIEIRNGFAHSSLTWPHDAKILSKLIRRVKISRGIREEFLEEVISLSFMVHFLISPTYTCLFFRQNGGDSLLQSQAGQIPQLFNINCG